MNIEIPYYKSTVDIAIPDRRLKGILTPKQTSGGRHEALSEAEIVAAALAHPVGSERLSVISEGKKKILLITSDHTRPVPSKITIPLLLREIRTGAPNAEIIILIATGFHRATNAAELVAKFGKEVLGKERIVIHDSFDDSAMVSLGLLPSGGELWINGLVDWAELVVAEGFIEPHFFAGFSGGRKSILPGICSAKTIMYNHNSVFIADENSRAGILKENPIHKDMIFAAEKAGLKFILNVTLDNNKKISGAFAGDPLKAHESGCAELLEKARVKAVKADIVVTSNGGYPLDQNVYQTVKSMTAAEACVNEGGVIIVISSCCDGHGGEGFYRWFSESSDAREVFEKISSVKREDTLPDQWEAQILARVLLKCKKVIIVSKHADPVIIEKMHMLHAYDFESALSKADEMLNGKKDIVVIPDGVGVIIPKK